MSKGIFIFDENLIKKGVIYGYEEFRIKQQLVNAGDFTITIATEKNGVDLLVENSIIYATPNLSGVILEVENYQKKTGNYTIIKGKTLNALLGYRIVHNFTLESDTESIAKTLVDENLVNSSDSNRNIPLSIEINNNNGSTQEINANKQVLSNVLEEVLSVDDYGHKVYLENEQLKYDVIIPNNTSVQFSNKIYNLNEATQIKSQSGYRNVAYIDNGDTMFEYGNETGINRREIILTDKRITSSITAGYKAQQELSSKHYKTESIQGKIRIIGNPFKYGEDYSLGDYVTVVYRDVVYTVQVTEVEQIFSGNNGYELYLYFGKPMRSVSKKIQDIQTKAEKTDVIEAELVSSVETIETALEGKSDTTHNHNLNDLSEKSYNSLTDKPTSLPANGGNADTVDGEHASAFANAVHGHSELQYRNNGYYNASNGVLIDIQADKYYQMITLIIKGNGYIGDYPLLVVAQAYRYQTSIISAKQMTISSKIPAIKFMVVDGRIKAWFPNTASYQTVIAEAYTMGGDNIPVNVSNNAEPSGQTMSTVCSLLKNYHSGNTIVDANGFIKEV
jgi:hypothetical protein